MKEFIESFRNDANSEQLQTVSCEHVELIEILHRKHYAEISNQNMIMTCGEGKPTPASTLRN